MRLCRFSGLNGRPRLSLVRSTLIRRAALRRTLLRDFDKLPRQPAIVNCPSDDGSQILALLAYPNGRRVAVSVGLTGCEIVTNGSVSRTAAGTPLVGRLKQVARPG